MTTFSATLRGQLDTLLWTLLPGVCVLCEQPSHVRADLCDACRAALPWLDPATACYRCGMPAGDRVASCPACRARPLPYARTVAAFRYADPIAGVVQRLKFRG